MKNKSKVILLPCNSYREELVYDSLKKGLKLLGGLEALISKDEKILLKPNLLKRAEVEKAVITHPAVVGMFGKLLKEEGYERVILADSCGHGNTTKVIAGTGMDTYLQELGKIPCLISKNNLSTSQCKSPFMLTGSFEKRCFSSRVIFSPSNVASIARPDDAPKSNAKNLYFLPIFFPLFLKINFTKYIIH